jgi:hypothetical protein
MEPTDYEVMVADICQQIVGEERATIHRRKKFAGKSGQHHEIDVSVEFRYMKVRFLVLLECKWWNKQVGADQIMILAQRMEDIGAQKGILVTKVGFQRGAFTVARSKGIALVLCRTPQEFGVLMEKNPASPSAGGVDDVINSLYEQRFSYYVLLNDRNTEHTAFPLLLDDFARGK